MSTDVLKGLDFLSDEEVRIPVGGVMTSDLIGFWHGGIAYSFLAELDKSVVKSEGVTPSLVTGNGPWYRYYFETFEKCQEAIKALELESFGKPKRPDQEWRFETPAAKLLNVSGDDNPFGDPAIFAAQVATLRSNKARHEIHMIALPAAVAASANKLGFANPGFPMDELLELGQDVAATEAKQRELIGSWVDEDAPKRERYKDAGYEQSVMWKRRAVLWNALGEDDPKKYQPIGRGTRFDTESGKLSKCLQILATKWGKPIWGRLVLVPDPRVDAVYTSRSSGDVGRLNVPALVEIFPDEAAARAAAEAEGTESTPASSASTEKTVPEAYKDYPEMFHEAVERFKAKGIAGPPPVVLQNISSEPDFQGCPAELVLKWLQD
jgi:hypothetical protein